MSLVIKGANTDKLCEDCPIDELWCSCDLTNCPLVELPTPHGRLIDATAFRQKLNKMILEDTDESTMLKVMEELEKTPTIIEAEMEE